MTSKSTKRALISSALAILMCVAMLIGTTFAWFTDTASTAVNKIQAGTLDVQLLDASGNSLEGQTLSWQKAAGAPGGEQVLWEPGCTYKLQPIVIKNNGNLALKYKIVITGIRGDAKLNEAIEWTMTEDGIPVNINDGAEVPLAPNATSGNIIIKGQMKENAGNEYQGLSIDGIAITVYATQKDTEFDSFNNSYDAGATYPVEIIPAVNAVMTATGKNTEGKVTAYSYANSDNTMIATYTPTPPAAETAAAPTIVVKPTSKDAGNVTINAATQDAVAYDVSLKDASGTPLNGAGSTTVKLFIGKGLSNVKVYHYADEMTGATYDPTTGYVTFTTDSFSPFTIVFDSPVAVAGGVSYYSFADAVKNAKSGETVTVLKDCTVPGEIVFPEGKTLTVDWNGKTITAEGNRRGLWATINGTVTMKGSGYVGDKTHESVGYLFYVNGTLNIEGTATYESGLTVAEMRSESSALKISGGRYIGDQWNNVYWTLNKLDAYRDSAVISVTGGSFYKYDPSNGHTESPDDNFVAAGKGVIKNGDWYEVISGTFVSTEAELTAALTGTDSTIYLAKDIELTSAVTVTKSVTLDGCGHTISYTGKGHAFQTNFTTTENVIVKNCVFEKPENTWANTVVGGITYQNCTFNGGCVYVTPSETDPTITIEGCTFDGAMLTIDFMNTVKRNTSEPIDGTLNAVLRNNTFNVTTPFDISKMHTGVGLVFFIREDSGFYTNNNSRVNLTVENNTFSNQTGNDSFCAYQIIQTWTGSLTETTTIPAVSAMNSGNTFGAGAVYSWANYKNPSWEGWSKSVS